MAASEDTFALSRFRSRFVQSLVAVVVIAILSWAFGSLISFTTGFWLLVALVLLSLAVSRVGEISVPFVLSLVALLGLLVEFVLPPWLAEPFAPLVQLVGDLIGLQFADLDPVRLAVLAFGAIIAMWIVEVRFTSAFTRASGQPIAANPDTVARAVGRRLERLIDDWIGVGVAIGGLTIAVAGLLLEAGGDLAGEVLGVLGSAPVVSGAVTAVVVGFDNLGGEIPVVGGLQPFQNLTPTGYLILGIGLIVLGVAVKNR